MNESCDICTSKYICYFFIVFHGGLFYDRMISATMFGGILVTISIQYGAEMLTNLTSFYRVLLFAIFGHSERTIWVYKQLEFQFLRLIFNTNGNFLTSYKHRLLKYKYISVVCVISNRMSFYDKTFMSRPECRYSPNQLWINYIITVAHISLDYITGDDSAKPDIDASITCGYIAATEIKEKIQKGCPSAQIGKELEQYETRYNISS